jgi:DNA-binding PadR family transcriptional regulator
MFMHMAGKFGGRGGGSGPFGGRGGGGRGGPGDLFRAGRMLADGDLKLITLSLLAEAPRHGYDIIKALEERTSGIYSPSPGVVYPTLTFLEEAGYAASAADGNKKVFSITEAGQAHLADNREMIDGVLDHLERFGRATGSAGTTTARAGTRAGVAVAAVPKRATNSAPCAIGCGRRSATSSTRHPKSRPRRSQSSKAPPKRWKR